MTSVTKINIIRENTLNKLTQTFNHNSSYYFRLCDSTLLCEDKNKPQARDFCHPSYTIHKNLSADIHHNSKAASKEHDHNSFNLHLVMINTVNRNHLVIL